MFATRGDLQLHPLVPSLNRGARGSDDRGDASEPDRRAGGDPRARDPDLRGQGKSARAQFGVEQRHLEGGFRHRVARDDVQPRARASRAVPSSAARPARPKSNGMRRSARTVSAPSAYSTVYFGFSSAAHSPSPPPSSVSTRTRTTGRFRCVPVAVASGVTSTRSSRRSSTAWTLIAPGSPRRMRTRQGTGVLRSIAWDRRRRRPSGLDGGMVDAAASKAAVRKGVRVRIPLRAPPAPKAAREGNVERWRASCPLGSLRDHSGVIGPR